MHNLEVDIGIMAVEDRVEVGKLRGRNRWDEFEVFIVGGQCSGLNMVGDLEIELYLKLWLGADAPTSQRHDIRRQRSSWASDPRERQTTTVVSQLPPPTR